MAARGEPVTVPDTYERLVRVLEEHRAEYRLIDHPPEGRTEIVSPLRGNELREAAKCMVVIVKLGKKVTKYVLAVVPGDRRVDLNAIKSLFGATYVSFASPEIAEQLARTVPGTILPFSWTQGLELIVDPSLLRLEEIFFNAARLDRSIVLKTRDYVRIVKPRVERIARDG